MTEITLRARWVIPVDRPPIENGAVTIAGGHIRSVGPQAPGQAARDLGDVALLPALVNAHTHLEFSTFDEPWGVPGQPFHVWLSQIIARRRELFSEPIDRAALNRQAVERGLAESHAAGVAVLASPPFTSCSGWRATESIHCLPRRERT
jgi:aminodeoxyfutalosine deaminase